MAAKVITIPGAVIQAIITLSTRASGTGRWSHSPTNHHCKDTPNGWDLPNEADMTLLVPRLPPAVNAAACTGTEQGK
jgi:hypothetical protein